MPCATLPSSSASKAASIGTSSGSNKAQPMPATVTQGPEQRILYEPCVRPSGVRNCRSHSVGKCCHLRSDPDAGISDANLAEKADKWVQTLEASLALPPKAAEVQEVRSDVQQLQTMRHRSPPPGDGQVTRSASRDSLNTWPPLEQTPRQLSVKLRKPKKAVIESRRVQAVQPNDMTVPTTRQPTTDMPQLDWTRRCIRGDLQLRRVVRRRAVFLVDIDFAAIVTAIIDFVLIFGLVVLVMSTLKRLFWPEIMDDWVPYQPHPI